MDISHLVLDPIYIMYTTICGLFAMLVQPNVVTLRVCYTHQRLNGCRGDSTPISESS